MWVGGSESSFKVQTMPAKIIEPSGARFPAQKIGFRDLLTGLSGLRPLTLAYYCRTLGADLF